jgi:nitrate/nitrite transporter NarK
MLFSGLIQGASFALIPALSGDSSVNARANGALTQVGNIGSVAGPPVFAGVIAASGTSFGPFAMVVAIACLAGLALSVVAWRVSTRRSLLS